MSVVAQLPLVEALWWFIQNHAVIPGDVEQELFLQLDARYREEYEPKMMPMEHAP